MYPQLYMQFGTLARMLQADPPPKAVKVTMSKRVPLVGDELAAYEEEQNRIKKEEALKASLIKEEESKATHGSHISVGDPMVIDDSNTHVSSDGISDYLLCAPIKLTVMISFLELSLKGSYKHQEKTIRFKVLVFIYIYWKSNHRDVYY